jgi:HlyD family secretion protein
MIKKIRKYIVAHKVISGIVVLVVIIIGYYTYTKLHSSTVATQYVFGKVQRGDLVVSVSGTGQVATLSKVDIKPQTTGQSQTLGQIIKVNVMNGQAVKAGDVVAVLDGKTALQSVNQARSSVASAQATYDKLVNGPTASDLQSNQNSLQSAQISVQNALQNLATQLQSAYITNSNSVYLNTDPFFVDPLVNADLSINGTYFTRQDLQAQVNNDRRITIPPILDLLKKDATDVLTSADPVALTQDAITKLTAVRSYFDDMTTLLTSYATGISDAGRSAIDTDKGIASSARTSANSAVNSTISALQTYQSAIVSLSQASTSLAFKQAPPNPDDVVVAQAQLDNAKANLANAQETYASRIITAPFDGQIGGLTAQVGQQISSSDVLGSIITPQKVVNVSLNEVDAAKVVAGDPVVLTFDALPNVTILGKVNFEDPLGTVTQGVVNYSVQIVMNDQNNQIKTGMTATAVITTDTHANVLIVPTAAVTKVGNRSVVMVPNTASTTANATTSNDFAGFVPGTATSTGTSTRVRGSGTRTFTGATGTAGATQNAQATTATVHAVPVTVGISNETSTEILSGLNEGETVVVRTISGTTSTAAASTARAGLFGIGGGGIRTGGGAATGR